MKDLAVIAKELRRDVIKMLTQAGSGHTGGSLGMADVMATLYFEVAKLDPQNPDWPKRDRILLSNGHICPILYATLARRGFFPVEELKSLRQLGSRLQGHPHYGELPGVENTSGPLGQGISQAVGMALAGRMYKNDYRVFCLMSDGELDEGQCWEAFLLASKEKLDNLTMIIDRNNIQLSGKTEQILPLEPLKEKLASFGLDVVEIDGHNFKEIIAALVDGRVGDKPRAIIAKTIMGKGVSFMENDFHWHGKAPTAAEAEKALLELN